MNRLLDIYFAPKNVFTKLKENPRWLSPFIIVLVVIAITAAVTVGMTKDMITQQQRKGLEERGLPEEQIEQIMSFSQGPFPLIIAIVGTSLGYAVIIMLFTLIINFLIRPFGGNPMYRTVFSVVCFASLIKIPAAILKMILVVITKSPYVTTSLVLFVPSLAKTSFAYQFLAGFDFFIIWEMILVAIGISITNELKQKNAYILVFFIWIVSVFIGIGLGSVFKPGIGM
jgi:hypothetical protein